jgi:hypothetical protein
MKRVGLWFFAVLVLAGVCLWGWWTLDLRWRPHTIERDQAQIASILEGAGWVSPKLAGAKLYMVSYRSCPDCVRFETVEFPKLQAAGVDTRVIVIARPDLNGAAKSTPAERATVAQLWIGRDWNLFQRWTSVTPPDAWTAPGIPPADGDTARTAVVEAGRHAVETLRPLLAHNGIRFAYPTLVWWNKQGVMRGCACEKAATYRNVERELGA